MFVRDYMTRNPVTVGPDTTFPEAMNLLRRNKIRRLPVMEHDRLVGIVAEKDLLSNQPSPATTLSIYEIYALLERLRVRQIMTHPVYTVGEDCPLEEAAHIMVEHAIACLPIMEGDKLTGIITETDIFKALVEVLGGLEKGTRLTLRLPERRGELASISTAFAQAGGNIVAVTTTRLLENSRREVTVKEVGADPDKLKQLLVDGGAEILDIRPSTPYPVRIVS